jgi:hypothetical protein
MQIVGKIRKGIYFLLTLRYEHVYVITISWFSNKFRKINPAIYLRYNGRERNREKMEQVRARAREGKKT